jgi:DNA-binding NtrC family response regulator
MNRPTILIADDQPDVLEALRLLLKAEGIASVPARSPVEVLAALSRETPALVLTDLNYTRDTTSGREGLDLIAAIRRQDVGLPIVAMTAWGSIDLVVQAMRAGANDFIEKPWDNQRLLTVLRNQLALAASRGEAARLKRENEILRDEGDADFVADSEPMQRLLAQIERVAPTDANVLILGENGTGKGVVARRLHARSLRADRPLVKVNMGGIPESVFEAEMFGHVRGAFTDAKSDRIGRFELADGGTLFLDEIADIPPAQQPKLLRVLEDGELERVGSSRTLRVDVRLISATNADLPAEVASGTFRKDLLFRLNTVELRLPPLRERGEDIARLADAFLARAARRYQRAGMRLEASARRALEGYAWPGNVRELAHVIERAALMATNDRLDASALNLTAGAIAVDGAAATPAGAPVTVDQAEERLVRQTLEQTGGNIQRAAALLGLSRPALYRRMEKYGIG